MCAEQENPSADSDKNKVNTKVIERHGEFGAEAWANKVLWFSKSVQTSTKSSNGLLMGTLSRKHAFEMHRRKYNYVSAYAS